MGRDLDEPENNYNSRFSVRVRQLKSGRFDILLDSAGSANHPDLVADSLSVNGVTLADRFTEGCIRNETSGRPVIGILRDSVYERRSHPRFAWYLDTLRLKIVQLSPDSTMCFLPGPE